MDSKEKDIQLRTSKKVMLEIIKECGFSCYSVYMVIFSHKNKAYNSCFPSLNIIAKESNCSIRTVQRCIKELVDNKFIYVSSGYSSYNSHYYFLREHGLYTKEAIEKIKQIIKDDINNKDG